MKKPVLTLLAAVVITLAVSATAVAESGSGKSGSDQTTSKKNSQTTTRQSSETTRGHESSDSSSKTETEHTGRLEHFGLPNVDRQKLDDQKKKVCEAKQPAINQAMDGVRQRSGDRFDRLGKLTEMVQKFYTSHNLTVTNYDQLVATVTTAKAAAQTAKDDLTAQPKFDCASDGPKADIQAFELKRQEKIEAFKAYRDAVKALADAVRQAAKENNHE